MAGYSQILVMATTGQDSWGATEVIPLVMFLIGEGHRQWIEARYFGDVVPMFPSIKVMIPEGPNHPDMLLDACLAFIPEMFSDCPSFAGIKPQLERVTSLDFDMGTDGIPDGWTAWREEARARFGQMLVQTIRIDGVTHFASLTPI